MCVGHPCTQYVNTAKHRLSVKNCCLRSGLKSAICHVQELDVHFNSRSSYLSVIEHAHKRDFLCHSSKSRTPVDLQVRR